MRKKLKIIILLCVIILSGSAITLFAGQNRTITVDPPAGYRDYRSNIPHGSYSVVSYYSNSERKNRTMGVYLPPNYSASKSYNTMYFLHGGGGTYKEGYDYCRPDIMMDNLLSEGKIDPMIVVMPDYNSPALTNGFESEMMNAVIPYIESNYSAVKNKDGRALCGYSMGGINTIAIGSKHYDTFSYLGCFSGATDTGSDGPQFSPIYNNPTATNQQIKTLMLSCGTEDSLSIYPKTVAVHNGLTQRVIDHLYHYCSGGHDATFWSKTLYFFAINIFGRIDGNISAPTPTPIPGTISIAAGSSSAVGSFSADQYYSGGSTYSNSNTVDLSQITGNPPPAALFNNERYGAMSYTIPGFTAGNSYEVTMYFAETYLTSSGSRRFNVSINGATALSNFDIYASAGGQNKAITRSFTATANSSGQIVIQFTSVTENPKINGIIIKPGGSNPTPTPTPIYNTPTPTPTPVSGAISIAAGSSSAVGSFQADQYYSGGSTYSNSNTVDLSQITGNPSPAALFNNERYGAMSYTIPGLTAGSMYTVTLYFAETYLTSSGSRRFNVSINGASVLSNFDIYASAGGQNKAIARSFTTTANSSGQIVIQFTSVTENPKINGISVK